MNVTALSLLARKFIHRLSWGILFLSVLLILAACRQFDAPKNEDASLQPIDPNLLIATFAGGCFWCTESDFDKMPGVVSTISGYIGGTVVNPTYQQVVAGNTGHVEAVQVYFDPAETDFSKLLAAYWFTIDPLTPYRQFCDVGTKYRSVIFYHNPEQKKLAEASKSALDASGRFTQPVVTEILSVSDFFPAEDYHQDYALKNPLRYAYYRSNCGRDERLQQIWETTN